VPRRDLEEIAEKVKEELAEYEIGGEDLDVIFDPLIRKCMEEARNEREFRQCIDEAFSTLKMVIKKVK